MLVNASAISGFVEFLPEDQIILERMKRIIQKHYELFGFTPIEVAAVERREVLLSKSGENTKQIYGISPLERADQEHGDKEGKLALHFDLTVPLARYVAQNYGKLDFPFRRYQMQKVWRGERPQMDKGRFREFYQCDIDVIGDGELGLMHDAEMPAVIHGIFSELQVGEFIIHLNNRKITQGLLEHLGIPPNYTGGSIEDDNCRLVEDDKTHHSFSLLDRLDKCGIGVVKEAFQRFVGISEAQCDDLIQFVTHREDTPNKMVAWLKAQERTPTFMQGVEELATVVGHMQAFGLPEKSFMVDTGMTRGLEYYTGTVYETLLVHHESNGSVCSGGRFDDLASLFINKKLPGVGISIGLTRLFNTLKGQGLIAKDGNPKVPSRAIILRMEPELLADYFAIATKLRSQGIPCEVLLEERKLEKQVKYAVKKRIPYGLFMNRDQQSRGICAIRDFRSGQQQEISLDEVASFLKK